MKKFAALLSHLSITAVAIALAACGTSPEPTAPPPPAEPTAAAAPVEAKITEVPVTTTSPEARALFVQARDLDFGNRPSEAEPLYKQALALDPTFAQAQLAVANSLVDKERLDAIAKARTLAEKLPESERLWIELTVAGADGKEDQVIAAEKKLGELVPGDWRVQMRLASRAAMQQRHDDAIAGFKKVTELNPNAGVAWNDLGYQYMQTNKNDEAVAAFEKFAAVNATDPNARDSLGDALLRVKKYPEAEASFMKALAIDPHFALSWSGVALSHAMRNDWKSALAAMDKYVADAPRDLDKAELTADVAWWQLAAGKAADAEKTLQRAEKLALDHKQLGLHAFLALNRAQMQNAQGKSKDALKSVDEADKRVAAAALSGMAQINFKHYALAMRLRAQSDMKKKDEAAKSAAEIEAIVKGLPDVPFRQSQLHEARGDVALAGGDAKAAIAEYAQCSYEVQTCLARGVVVADKAGDKAAADGMRARALEYAGRDSNMVLARWQAKLFAAR